jgi:hypothetical protein
MYEIFSTRPSACLRFASFFVVVVELDLQVRLGEFIDLLLALIGEMTFQQILQFAVVSSSTEQKICLGSSDLTSVQLI